MSELHSALGGNIVGRLEEASAVFRKASFDINAALLSALMREVRIRRIPSCLRLRVSFGWMRSLFWLLA